MLMSLSLWSLDQARIADDVDRFDPLVDSYHVDVMDGRFADGLLFGPLAVETLRGLTDRTIVAHLMVDEPIRWMRRFVRAGADEVVVHVGAPSAERPERGGCDDFRRTVDAARSSGFRVGAAIGLHEPTRPVLDRLDELSTVLVLGTRVGVRGRSFDRRALDTVRLFADARAGGGRPAIFVDGGIRSSSVVSIADAGADGVVAGSLLATADDPARTAAMLAALGATRGSPGCG